MIAHDLPNAIAKAIEPVFVALPPKDAMAQLVVDAGPSAELIALVERVCYDEAIASRPTLAAALWLYIDDLDRSHRISQDIDDATGSFWHGIMHRREGDFGNSHYWFRRVGRHPAVDVIESIATATGGAGYDSHAFIDAVESDHRCGHATQALVDLQRAEWRGLFEWCSSMP